MKEFIKNLKKEGGHILDKIMTHDGKVVTRQMLKLKYFNRI